MTSHNLVRDIVHSAANDRRGLGAVLEKPALLIPRDPSDDDRPPGPDPPDPSSPSQGQWRSRGLGFLRYTSALRLSLAPPDPPLFLEFSPLLSLARRPF